VNKAAALALSKKYKEKKELYHSAQNLAKEKAEQVAKLRNTLNIASS
jgi:hypothetical protein